MHYIIVADLICLCHAVGYISIQLYLSQLFT